MPAKEQGKTHLGLVSSNTIPEKQAELEALENPKTKAYGYLATCGKQALREFLNWFLMNCTINGIHKNEVIIEIATKTTVNPSWYLEKLIDCKMIKMDEAGFCHVHEALGSIVKEQYEKLSN